MAQSLTERYIGELFCMISTVNWAILVTEIWSIPNGTTKLGVIVFRVKYPH